MRENAVSYKISVRAWHSTLDVSDLASALNVGTKNFWNVGDRLRRGLGSRDKSFWCSQDIAGQSPYLEETLEEIAKRLFWAKDVITSITRSGGEVEVFIGFFLLEEMAGLRFSGSLMKRLAELDVTLSFDIYGVGFPVRDS